MICSIRVLWDHRWSRDLAGGTDRARLATLVSPLAILRSVVFSAAVESFSGTTRPQSRGTGIRWTHCVLSRNDSKTGSSVRLQPDVRCRTSDGSELCAFQSAREKRPQSE